MMSLSQQEKMRRNVAAAPSNSHLGMDQFEHDFKYFPYSQQRNTCPHHGNAHFYDEQPAHREHCEVHSKQARHPGGYDAFPIDYSAEIERILRQQAGLDLMTPPATATNSRSTLFNYSAQQSYFSNCSSPVTSDQFDLLSCGSPVNEFSELDKGCYTKEGFGVVYGQENIFTAEHVHSLVKHERKGAVPRLLSNKVFVGGISHSMNREIINNFFAQFGPVFVDWPVKGPRTNARGKTMPMSSYSYLFLVYVKEESVIQLMQMCDVNAKNEFHVCVPGTDAQIQIRPWFVQNAFYVAEEAKHEKVIDIHRTVFVGGLPRIVTAEEIARVFATFGTVLLVTIDIDQDYGYPKGAARVAFRTDTAFNKALERKYIKFDDLDTSKTTIEIKPYVMEDVGCDQCGGLWSNPFLEIFDQLNNENMPLKKVFLRPFSSF
ncbi:unnamed protein product [Caenorhabditis sp. 36 PRJEB53466]|nr:unnamed protein product [Caenorhabditis sp. 36 PRJEB53466]